MLMVTQKLWVKYKFFFFVRDMGEVRLNECVWVYFFYPHLIKIWEYMNRNNLIFDLTSFLFFPLAS